MAFCKHCGSKLEDGAKFCPKCGNPTNGEVDAHKSDGNDKNNEDAKNTKVGCISLIVIMLFIGYIVNKCSGGEDSKATDDANVTKTEQVASESNGTKADSEKKKIADEGYKFGHNDGFKVNDAFDDKAYRSMARTAYTMGLNRQAPSTPEEKELYDLFEQNYMKGVHDAIKEIKEREGIPNEFLEKGHTYKSSLFYVDGYNCKIGYQYELSLFNDGSVELIKFNTYPNHEYEDNKRVFECTIEKKDESKRDVRKQWYQIEGKCGNEVTKTFVDMEGKMYSNYGYSDFDAVGNRDCYQATFKRIK